ncbi:hypothetical protein HU200_065792 [Digitaria exilis]|uniref:BPM/SPOP BACK domain-containing protein n=1 Tax=Digitaria exilis TaxID=1010633 RepID=A0A834ZY40_9POAL|nr:hypothetical protein HU200_065792 [Digitaria exilis]
MLRFMYTDACPAEDVDELGGGSPPCEMLRCLLTAADRCPELKTKCVSFLVDQKNFRDAVLTDGFVQLVQKFPGIVAELKEVTK